MADNHLRISDLPYEDPVRKWLNGRCGEKQADEIWNKTCRQYDAWLLELPNYGGKKNPHALAICGGLLVFALYSSLPDQPPIAEMRDLSMWSSHMTRSIMHPGINLHNARMRNLPDCIIY